MTAKNHQSNPFAATTAPAQITVRGDLVLETGAAGGHMQPTVAGLLPAQPSSDHHHLHHHHHNNNNNNNNNSSSHHHNHHQHTGGAGGGGAGGMDGVQAMQSMDWLFKKERIYLLAQFWQQRATLAEKEVTTLKERMSGKRTPETGGKEGAAATCLPDGTAADSATGQTARTGVEDELIVKDKEISQLAEDVRRLQASLGALQEAHTAQVRGLEERLDAKSQHIARLEARLDRRREYEDSKRDGSVLRSPSVEAASGEDSKHFEQLVIERTKALAHSESIKAGANEGQQDHHREPSESPAEQQQDQQQSTTGAGFPGLQNVEQFGPILGEEIVSTWRRQHAPSAPNALASPSDRGGSSDKSPSAASTPAPPEQTTPTHNGRATKSPEHNNNSLRLDGDTSLIGNSFVPGAYFRSEPFTGSYRFAEDPGNLPPGAMVGRLGDSLIPKGDPMEARLQEMLRYNMDKYANQNLDTLHISRRVRELLSVHNIGQRLFAKYVLGLSQGTVSELLSKPKPWDKLTEKGRDSYRKMHAWACDDNAVLLLKSLIPKKVKEPGMAPFGRHDSSDMTEERIAHILSEAIKGGPGVGSSSPQDDDDRGSAEDPASPRACAPPSPYGSRDSGSQHARRMRKYENDDISQEKVARIYQEELAKLMGRRVDQPREAPAGAFPGLFPHFFSAGNPQSERMPDDNVRLAIEAYHRELLKMQHQAGSASQLAGLQAIPGLPCIPGLPGLPNLLALQHMQQLNGASAQDLSLPKEAMMTAKMMNGDLDSKDAEEQARHGGSAFSLVRPKQESNTTTTNSSASSPLGNAILPPAMTPTEEYSAGAVASPLQRMASITNSLISQPPNQTHHSPSQRPLKAVLPPITQQQFDLFNNLNTEEIVRRVKESLSQYSISQRLFGESVLGLSQGSVSDLLARPKPWHMLTQKGREPFIRMKMFLEDDNAVHKLVASQYKIAPEKLMRTGSYSGSPQCPANLSKQLTNTPKMMSDASSILSKLKQEHNQLLPASLQLSAMNPHGVPPGMTAAMLNSQQQQIQQAQQQAQQQQQQQPMLLTPPGMPPHHAITLHNQRDIKPEIAMGKPGSAGMVMHHSPMPHSPMTQQQQGGGGMRGLPQHISPSVYEMAALTQDLDTQTITTKIKEALLANNIGQKIFGEAVLGLSQGSVSELLSKPKPWHMLSIKGREPFIRMQLWLSDAHNVDRLQALKNERREANKRRRSTGPGGAQDNSSDTSSNDTSEFYHSHSPGPQNGPPSAKKQRVLFSEEQKEALRLAFALDPYPNVATIEFLAVELNLSTRTITNWFHNHRMRLKQQVPHSVPGQQNDLPSREVGSQQQVPFDPVQFKLLLNQRLLELQKERIGMGAVPIPYPPYFAGGNLAALIGRGLDHLDPLGALSSAVKEEMSGLDLSMASSMKHRDDFDSDCGSEDESEDGGRGGRCEEEKEERGVDEPRNSSASRSNRRKPAAPQWVNPDWQDKTNKTSVQDEVIINGVCVMKTEDYRVGCQETVRVEPTPVPERFEDDASEATERPEADEPTEEPEETEEPAQSVDGPAEEAGTEAEAAGEEEEDAKHTEREDERWDY